ncbi:Ger(x)C family spore germination protein [Clostridium sediminicola]|uniref:Ger(x)C family spore germination protein n=1 Tax=Clostridium sediminicola TaxID=3114879 RepID=UPI0031F1EDC8
MKPKKIVIVILLIITSIVNTSCFSYRDIDNAIFATMLLIDIDEYNNPVLYIETYKPVGGDASETQSGKRLIFKGEGKTLFEALRTVSLATSYKINFTQNRIIIFTEKAAESGLDRFVDFLDRDQELLIRAFVCITKEDAQKLIETEFKENKYIGVFIIKMIDNIGSSSRGVELSLNNYMKQRVTGDKTSVIPLIQTKKEKVGENKLEIVGGAAVKEDKMVGVIERTQGQGFNFLLDNIESGTLEPENPEVPGKFLSLEILKSKTNSKIEYDGKKVKLYKKIKVNTALGEVQGKFDTNESNINNIREMTEKNIEKACRDVFDSYKEKGIDIFDITEEFERKYPHDKVEDVIKITELNLDVNVNVNFYNETKGFK